MYIVSQDRKRIINVDNVTVFNLEEAGERFAVWAYFSGNSDECFLVGAYDTEKEADHILGLIYTEIKSDEKIVVIPKDEARKDETNTDDNRFLTPEEIAEIVTNTMLQNAKEHTESKKTWQRGVNTKEIISDEKLHDEYFKKGKSVNTIAGELGIKPWGLYKRVEEMKEQKLTQETECVSKREDETPGI